MYLLCVWICIYAYILGRGGVFMRVNWGGFMGKRCIGIEEGECVRVEWGYIWIGVCVFVYWEEV